MQYLNEDRKSIGNVYAEMYKPKTNSSVIKENQEFYDIEDHADQLDGDLDLPIGGSPDEDGDYLNDALEEKVYGHMNEQFGETFRRQCDEIKEKFNLSDDEFCMFFKGWFDEKHVRSHLEGEF